jgi:hypothetical protein
MSGVLPGDLVHDLEARHHSTTLSSGSLCDLALGLQQHTGSDTQGRSGVSRATEDRVP